jgi:hypothetical protein
MWYWNFFTHSSKCFIQPFKMHLAKHLISLAFLQLASSAAVTCSNPPVRKEWSALHLSTFDSKATVNADFSPVGEN